MTKSGMLWLLVLLILWLPVLALATGRSIGPVELGVFVLLLAVWAVLFFRMARRSHG